MRRKKKESREKWPAFGYHLREEAIFLSEYFCCRENCGHYPGLIKMSAESHSHAAPLTNGLSIMDFQVNQHFSRPLSTPAPNLPFSASFRHSNNINRYTFTEDKSTGKALISALPDDLRRLTVIGQRRKLRVSLSLTLTINIPLFIYPPFVLLIKRVPPTFSCSSTSVSNQTKKKKPTLLQRDHFFLTGDHSLNRNS